MRSNGILRSLTALLAFALLGGAVAQYDIHPFEDDPVGISAAFGAEMALLRLQAADALYGEGVEEDEIEEVLEGLELEWMRFAAALRDADEDLFEEADGAFEAVEEAGDDDAQAAVSEALPVAERVRDAVSGPLVEDPAYAAAILSLLLVSETGIAEGWEEAAEGEVGPYAVGWAGMPRAYELWEIVKPQANENQTFEVEDQLGELQALFENPTPPNMEGADPEEGEGAAVHISGFLEDVTGAWLFPDRDLAGLMANTQEVATSACEAYDSGDDLLGDARIAWVGYAFNEYMAGTLGLFAPEPTAELSELLAGVTGEEEEDEEGEGDDAAEEEEDGDDEEVGFDPASCQPLLEAFGAAGAPFGL